MPDSPTTISATPAMTSTAATRRGTRLTRAAYATTAPDRDRHVARHRPPAGFTGAIVPSTMDGDAGTYPGTSTEGTSPPVGIQEAAARLGVSVNTVRRWVKDGRLRSERIPRPQGYSVVVYMPTTTAPAQGEVPAEVPTQEVPDQVGGLARAEAMASYNRQLLEPVMQHVEQLTIRLEALARDNGDLAAENRALRAALAERPAAEPSRRSRWAFWRD
jgi:hypothetical protein